MRERRETLERLVVEADVQNRLHHAGHRDLRTRAYAHEQGVLWIAEDAPKGRFDGSEFAFDLVGKHARFMAVAHVVPAGVGRDRKAWWHGKPKLGHFGEIRAFTTEQVDLLTRAGAERVHVLITHS